MIKTPMPRFKLPSLSDELNQFFIDDVANRYEALSNDPELQRWQEKPLPGEPSRRGHFMVFTYDNIPELDAIFSLLPWKIIFTLTVIQNTDMSRPCQILPHIDRSRKVAINYTVKLGGPKVYTTFMKDVTEEETKRKFIGENFEDRIYSRVVAKPRNWYIFESCKMHGVEDVMDTRLVLTCQTEDRSITWDQFTSTLSSMVDFSEE